LRFFVQNTVTVFQKFDHNIGFWQKTAISLPKIGKNLRKFWSYITSTPGHIYECSYCNDKYFVLKHLSWMLWTLFSSIFANFRKKNYIFLEIYEVINLCYRNQNFYPNILKITTLTHPYAENASILKNKNIIIYFFLYVHLYW
jgi:hypothetical protein